MRAQIDGTLKPGATEFEAGKLGKLKIINGSQSSLVHRVFTKEDIDQFNSRQRDLAPAVSELLARFFRIVKVELGIVFKYPYVRLPP
jgi:hypothetical protein